MLAATGLLGDVRLGPEDDALIVDYGVGLTDVVKRRAESSDAMLRPGDFDVPGFLGKIETCAPLAIAFNGEKAAKVVARHLFEAVPAIGPATWTIGATHVYRLPSSSSAAAKIGWYDKRRAWESFGCWIRGFS